MPATTTAPSPFPRRVVCPPFIGAEQIANLRQHFRLGLKLLALGYANRRP